METDSIIKVHARRNNIQRNDLGPRPLYWPQQRLPFAEVSKVFLNLRAQAKMIEFEGRVRNGGVHVEGGTGELDTSSSKETSVSESQGPCFEASNSYSRSARFASKSSFPVRKPSSSGLRDRRGRACAFNADSLSCVKGRECRKGIVRLLQLLFVEPSRGQSAC